MTAPRPSYAPSSGRNCLPAAQRLWLRGRRRVRRGWSVQALLDERRQMLAALEALERAQATTATKLRRRAIEKPAAREAHRADRPQDASHDRTPCRTRAPSAAGRRQHPQHPWRQTVGAGHAVARRVCRARAGQHCHRGCGRRRAGSPRVSLMSTTQTGPALSTNDEAARSAAASRFRFVGRVTRSVLHQQALRRAAIMHSSCFAAPLCGLRRRPTTNEVRLRVRRHGEHRRVCLEPRLVPLRDRLTEPRSRRLRRVRECGAVLGFWSLGAK